MDDRRQPGHAIESAPTDRLPLMDDLEVAHEAAQAGVDVIRRHFGQVVQTEWKGELDPVTAVDRQAEEAILSVIRTHRPHDRILAEESGGHDWSDGRVWIVDPLDGTVNFVHGLPQVATSVGLRSDGAGVVGVVASAADGETFAARAGQGATLDGKPIRVSGQDTPARALVATGFAYDRRHHIRELMAALGRVLEEFQDIRRAGSAALDLCWVAAGRLDAYWEQGIKPWDTAAGALILEEAGGRVTGFDGAEYALDGPGIVASNGLVHGPLLRAIDS